MTSSTTEPTDKNLPGEPMIRLSQAQLGEFLALWRLPTAPHRTVFLPRWTPLPVITGTFDTSCMNGDPADLAFLLNLLGVKLS